MRDCYPEVKLKGSETVNSRHENAQAKASQG